MWIGNSGSIETVLWDGISGSSDGAYVYGAIANMNDYLNVNSSEKVFYFKCKNCGRKILVNVDKIDVLELSCRSCGSSDMEKLCE